MRNFLIHILSLFLDDWYLGFYFLCYYQNQIIIQILFLSCYKNLHSNKILGNTLVVKF